MRFGRLLGATLALSLAVQGWSPPSEAAELMTAGWWWRPQTGTVALPPPPHVPPNGLAVGNAPDGPSAVSALRFSLQAGEFGPVLTLVVAEVFAPGTLGLVACPGAAPWFGTQAGPWDDRPAADCGRGRAKGVEAEDGGSWTFPMTSPYPAPNGLVGGLLDVVILPAEGSDPFEISFEAPTAESLRTTKASFSPVDHINIVDDRPSEESFIPPSGDFGGGSSFEPPLVPLLGDPAAPPAAADPTPSGAPQKFVPIARGPLPAADAAADPRPLALVVLLAALAIAAALGREPLPAPRLLGPMAGRRELDADESEVRGLGRFRRPRRGAAPSLH